MIIAQMKGGLGNQMFEYAAARSYQRSVSEKIILDTSICQDPVTRIGELWDRPYAMHVFKNLKADTLNFSFYKTLNKLDFSSKIKRKLFKLNTAFIVENSLSPPGLLTTKKKNIYLKGFFQSELYFKSIRNELLTEFEFPDLDSRNLAIKEKIVSTQNSLSLHIRRGDYYSSENAVIHASVNANYYIKAIDFVHAQLGLGQIDTFLFTDDIDWAKRNFKSDKLNINFIEKNEGEENSWKDMCLMSYCRHHIVANSSFSWWGAWLCKNQGINVAPKYWFVPGSINYNIYNIVPQDWAIIDYS